jgi:hypothetical protein
LLQLCIIAADFLIPFGDISCVGDLHFGECGFFGGIVGGANLVRAFECHVLEHVGEAGFAHGILRGAGIDQCEERKNWSLGPLANDERQPVREFFDRDALFKRCDILRRDDSRLDKPENKGPE